MGHTDDLFIQPDTPTVGRLRITIAGLDTLRKCNKWVKGLGNGVYGCNLLGNFWPKRRPNSRKLPVASVMCNLSLENEKKIKYLHNFEKKIKDFHSPFCQ